MHKRRYVLLLFVHFDDGVFHLLRLLFFRDEPVLRDEFLVVNIWVIIAEFSCE